MENNTHTTVLIEGEFLQNDARIILLQLLNSKINFHHMRKFSNEERFGKDREHSAKRLQALTKEKESLVAWLDGFSGSDRIAISCDIKMKVQHDKE